MEQVKPIWEQHGVTLEEYAEAFNEVLEQAWLDYIGNDVLLVIDKPIVIHRIRNIKVD